MIVLFTDFGLNGPYIGQMTARLYGHVAGVPVINLFADAPRFNPKAAAYLLSAYNEGFPGGSVFLCVVDPGVGDHNRRPVVMKTSKHWYVGPENGLLDAVAIKEGIEDYWEITWQPPRLSNSFHGRDLFAPIAADIATQRDVSTKLKNIDPPKPTLVGRDLYEIIYIDQYGNLITGIRAGQIDHDEHLLMAAHTFPYARTFSEVTTGQGFWYENSSGLVELAVNQDSAEAKYQVSIGEKITLVA